MSEVPIMGTHKLILDSLQVKIDAQGDRDYMGASGLGTKCDRELWYSYHQPKRDYPPRVQMIFDVGNILEDYIIGLLREAGLTVYEKDDNGEQFGFVEGFIAGHIDGVITGLPESSKPHLLEIKSANDRRFKEFQRKGCEAVEPKYWGQCHTYMLKMKLEKCLFIVINKNDCEIYIERITLDKQCADSLMLRGEELIAERDEKNVKRRYKKSTSFGCKFCNWKEECWKDEPV